MPSNLNGGSKVQPFAPSEAARFSHSGALPTEHGGCIDHLGRYRGPFPIVDRAAFAADRLATERALVLARARAARHVRCVWCGWEGRGLVRRCRNCAVTGGLERVS